MVSRDPQARHRRAEGERVPIRIAVLGAGNTLMGDDGAGVAALAALRETGVGGRAQLVEAGTAAFDAVALLDETVTHLVVIDTVSGGGPPGAVYRFTVDDVAEPADPNRASLHQVTLLEALRLAALSGRHFEEIVVIGVEPERIEWGEGLSETVAARLPDLAALVVKEIDRLTGRTV